MEHQESHPNDAGAKPERHASAHGKIARRGCLLTILGLAIIVTLAVVSEYLPKAGMTEELARAQADAKAAGLAVTMSEFQRKYPSTAEGQKVVEKVAGVIELLKWDYDKFRFATTPVPADPKTTTTFDVVRLVSELSGLKTEQVTSPGLYAYVVANKAQLDEIAELGRSTAIDSLNCRHEFTADTPMRRLDTKFRKSGGGIFLSVRQASRVLLPAAIFVALAEDDSARAYNLLFGWFILSRSMKVSGTSLVEAMIGVAVDGIALEVANELLRASPPKDLPTALRLHDFLDQARMRRDFLQGLEAGAIYSSQMLWHLIDERHVLPPGILKMETGFKESAQKDVARSLNELWASLTRGRRGPTLPSLAVWRIAAFGPSISELQECIAILTESVTRLDKLLSTTTVPDFVKESRVVEVWAESQAVHNPIAAQFLPSFERAIANARGREARAAVLQTAALMRVAELKSASGVGPMPANLEELSSRSGKAAPDDPLAHAPGEKPILVTDTEHSSYTITHRPNIARWAVGFQPLIFDGRWRP